jgi:hypothetical protein
MCTRAIIPKHSRRSPMTTRLPKSNDPTPIALDKLADQFLPVACHALQRDIERINGRLKDRGHPPIRLEGTVERDCESRYAIVCNLCISIAGPMGGPWNPWRRR